MSSSERRSAAENMKRKRGWIEADFTSVEPGNEPTKLKDSSNAKQKMTKKRNFDEKSSLVSESWITSGLWFETHHAQSIPELSIHPKKIQNATDSLRECLNSMKASVIIIKGPNGCGKTSLIRAVSKQLNCNLKVFKIGAGCNIFSDQLTNESELNEFKSFILSSLDIDIQSQQQYDLSTQRSTCLWVPDLPNVFLMAFEKLESILSEFLFNSTPLPIIFELPESAHGRALSFSNKFVMLNNVVTISMNSVAPTYMSKGLQLLGCRLPVKLKKYLSQNAIKKIVENSAGDMRLAINMAQFITLSRTTKTVLSENYNKDFSLGFFHAIGKVLNPKRVEVSDSLCRKCNVNPLAFSLTELVDSLSSGSQFFLSLVEENFCDVCFSVETFHQCFDDFVYCDLINAGRTSNYSMSSSYFESCVLLVCCASVSFWLSKCNQKAKRSFAPLRKPTSNVQNKNWKSSSVIHSSSTTMSRSLAFERESYLELMTSRGLKTSISATVESDEYEKNSIINFFDNSVAIEDFGF
ncbi:uncharacterized protein LOC142336232 [Convolutriloba macropyga]|uniref:uncharacterized protein LOC142336232 n=1 Tax=Convolutriloba macropyga TaxID=536237 RepID=UPI003F52039C